MKEWKINLNLLNARSQGISSDNFEAQIMIIQTDAMTAQAERLEGIYEVLAKIAEGGDKITLGPITMTAPEWLAQINRKFDQVDMLVNNNYRELLSKIAEQAPAPVTSDTAQEAREVLQMIADADTGTIQVDIDDEIASSDCRHCEWMKERAKEYLESHPAPVESHQAAGDEAKWPEDVVIVDMFGDDYELSHEYTDEIPVHRMRIDKMDDDGNYQNVLIFDSLKSIESIHNFTGQWLRARQGGTTNGSV